jgi:hypothetical protein
VNRRGRALLAAHRGSRPAFAGRCIPADFRHGLLAALALAAAAGCTAGRWTPPSGAREPAPDAAALWAEATRPCRAVATWAATLRVAGRVDAERIPTGLSVATGLTGAGRLRLEGRVLNRLVFTLAGSTDRALLRLEREREYVVDRAGAILDVLLGTDLGADRWMAVVTGCGTVSATMVDAARVGALVQVSTPDGQVYLGRTGAMWRPEAAITSGFEIEYRMFAGPWPADIRLWSQPQAPARVELRIGIENVVVDVPIADEAFATDPPDGWQRVEIVNMRRGIRAGGV